MDNVSSKLNTKTTDNSADQVFSSLWLKIISFFSIIVTWDKNTQTWINYFKFEYLIFQENN